MNEKFSYELLDEKKLTRVNENGKRLYVTEDGNKYPSVTTVLSYLSKKGIAKWRARVGNEEANRISTQAARAGTAMHQVAEDYVLGVKRDKEPNPLAVAAFNQVKPLLDQNVSTIYGVELQMHSDELRVAGTADLICKYNGRNTILDFKTSRRPKTYDHITNYLIQAATYAIMVEERYGLEIDQYAILMAVGDGSTLDFVGDIEYHKQMARQFFNLHNKGMLKDV